MWWAADEIERLRAMIPKDADGVTVVPGVDYYYGFDECSVFTGREVHSWQVMSCSYGWHNKVNGDLQHHPNAYRTREGAESAGEEING